MKNKFLVIILCALIKGLLLAQPPHKRFNTGINLIATAGQWGQGGLIPEYPVPFGSPTATPIPDEIWKVALSSAGPYGDAFRPDVIPAWNQGVTTGNSQYRWITYPNGCDPYAIANHMCSNPIDLWFKASFTLPPNCPGYMIDWDIWADDKIVDIRINGNSTNFPANSGNYQTPTNFKYCDFQIGPNEIVVHVRSGSTQTLGGLVGLMINSKPADLGSVSGPTSVCQGTVYPYSTAAVPGAISYYWGLPLTSPFAWSIAPPNSLTNQINAGAGIGPGVITVTATANGVCLHIDSLSVVAHPNPTIAVSPPHPSVCPGQCAVLTASGASTYTWIVTGFPNTNTLQVCPQAPSNYTVQGTNTYGCRDQKAITVGIYPPPSISVTATPGIMCPGVANLISAYGGTSYAWQAPFTSTLPIVVVTPTLSTTNTAVPISNTVVSVIVADLNGCIDTAAITLTPGIIIPLSVSDATLCTDVSTCITIGASSSFTGSVSYYWPPPINSNSQNPQICIGNSQTVTVVANSPGACTSSTVLAVTVQTCCPPPVETFNLPATTACSLSYNNLSLYASTQGTFSGPGVSNNNGVYSFNTNLALPSGSYIVGFTYTTSPWGCSYTLTQTLTILDPAPLVSISAPSHCVYDPNNVTLSAYVPGALVYYWLPTGVFSQTISVTPTANIVYTVGAGTPNGCTTTGTTQITLNNNCCPQTTNTPVLSTVPNTLTAGGSLTGPLVIDQDLTITGNGNFTFQAGDFIMNTGIKIVLDPGVTLVLEDAHLYACYQIWKGIVVTDGANVTSNVGPNGLYSMIEDAEIAIDVNNIGPNHVSPILDLNGIIFNKNRVGIALRNSLVDNFQVHVEGCVFTSREIPTSTMSWPNSTAVWPGLRWDNNLSSTSLSPPFMLTGNYPYNDLGQPPVGISIENIIVNGGVPGVGADFIVTGTYSIFDFNLFDYMSTGIYAHDASFRTHNNAFQNLMGTGIYADVSTDEGANVSLSSPQANTGNRFWLEAPPVSPYVTGLINGGVYAKNALNFDIKNALFRGNAPGGNWTHGGGIHIVTNRFADYKIKENKFTNLIEGVYMGIVPGSYLINGYQATNEIYAGNIDISQNAFGAQINSTNPLNTNDIMEQAIRITSPTGATWNQWATLKKIESNVIDRCRFGIMLDGLDIFAIGIQNNIIKISERSPQHAGVGIWSLHTAAYVTSNTVTCMNNYGYQSECMLFLENTKPLVACNYVKGGYAGFEFRGNNANTLWLSNKLEDNVKGLLLAGGMYNTVIGPQGYPSGFPTPSMGYVSNNQWIGPWGPNHFGTVVDWPSDATQSPLYVTPGAAPPNNSGGTQIYDYVNQSIINSKNPPFSCSHYGPFDQIPQFRGSSQLNIPEVSSQKEAENYFIYPNPVSGEIFVSSVHEDEQLEVEVMDMSGRIVVGKKLVGDGHNSIDLSELPASVYIVEIRNSTNMIIRKKIVKD